MSDYAMETGAVIFLGWLVLMLDGVLGYVLVRVTWVFALAVPPVGILNVAVVHLWMTRPSILH